MKPSSWDKQLGLASPVESSASQSSQTNNPSKECGGAGCKSPYPHLPEGRGEAFFLDILFHRMSEIGDISTTIRIKCSPLNIFLLLIVGSSSSEDWFSASVEGTTAIPAGVRAAGPALGWGQYC